MQLLCISNGHGEDVIAVRILQALQNQPQAPEIVSLPLVGEGNAYAQAGIPRIAPTKTMPSGGFIYMDGRQLVRDLQGGLIQLTWCQLRAVRRWAKRGGFILAVGDIVPLLFAWWSGAPYAFVGTAKSEYYLRDEAGWLPRRTWFERLESWSGSVYLPWERWLMRHRRCRAVFPRDALTTTILQQWGIPALDLGNPMMDGLEPTGSLAIAPILAQSATTAASLAGATESSQSPLTLLLLPGSRPPEAYRNWQVLLPVIMALCTAFSQRRSLRFLAAIALTLDLEPFRQALQDQGWQAQSMSNPVASRFTWVGSRYPASLDLVQSAFNDCLHLADFAIAMAGTATEQFVGLGKPAITIAGAGPQFTPAFAEAQSRHLGPSVRLIERPEQAVAIVQNLLADPDQLHLIADNGRRRLGPPGAAQRIAATLLECEPALSTATRGKSSDVLD
ncbi:lipid-A-disaccharide synthase-related protein [Trichothermofontia sichuanensis B231]|uniref:lipid-A-disaccharide synthase-related protein n=1 Tax=Trichothermofontia sichuanensis TaxID=3045816 RepID=UPI00224515C6|nr:lipid-A-disaccharide synthase-related protein [Trichothermofontia sichuanensis]UZQ53976.1 lipid-A-disaccharide synthase-related protein [Trichothermofontia sichuanensis B231]